ncbi:MAG: lysozyme [Chthonomonadaceae bacterium]|nr:lysozyme [Chthonomonadaceae bacterium]
MNREEIRALGAGVDVSHHNVDGRGAPIDWVAVLPAGFKFALVKATDGAGFVDPEFSANVHGAVAAGLVVGAYHLLRPGEDAVAQANLFLAQVRAVGIENLALGAAVDVEDPDDDPGAWDRISHSVRLLKVQHWLKPVEAVFPDRPLIYCIPHWWAQHFGLAADFSGYPLWAASPNQTPDLSGTTWQEWTIWQFNFIGTVPGIGVKSVDLDRTQ